MRDGYSVHQIFAKLNDIIITAADMSLRKNRAKNQRDTSLKSGSIAICIKCVDYLIKRVNFMQPILMTHKFEVLFINLENCM